LYTETSPSLDSIIYWFLKKSINLYGEAFVRKFSDKGHTGATTEHGVDAVRALWASKGISPTSLAMVDGSGLSPLNRVTTKAQVDILRYASEQAWFPGYFNAFPEYNGMKMKSGTIQGAKAFCGYHTSSDGASYIFSLIVNNYNGSASQVVRSMYTLLNTLK
jgi:D-alanyl-D-alanine carboxypeptidase/D-alanyl-D-alanine-endopeptidase (penicillin-binding protein 4)